MDALIGKTLGGFEVLSEIGRGGMAVVYKAYQRNPERYVALKVLPDHLAADESFVVRFLREAQIATQLRHPNIIEIFQVSRGNPYYIAMSWIDGETLASVIKREGALSPARFAAILAQVASALDYAHARGVVHRDVKPSNILLDRSGKAVLTDFGIAWASEGTKITRTGTVIGTPEYASPEQIRGLTLDARADIYALGIVAYEALTGRVPFQGDTLRVLHAQVYETPTSLRALNPKLPPQFERVVMQALAKEPYKRYPTATGFANDLASAAGIAPAPHKARASRAALVWIGIGVLLALMFIVGILFFAHDTRTTPTSVAHAPTSIVSSTTTPGIAPSIIATAALSAPTKLAAPTAELAGIQPAQMVVAVPSLIGLDPDKAIAKLNALGFHAERIQEPAKSCDNHVVLRQDPVPYTQTIGPVTVRIFTCAGPTATPYKTPLPTNTPTSTLTAEPFVLAYNLYQMPGWREAYINQDPALPNTLSAFTDVEVPSYCCAPNLTPLNVRGDFEVRLRLQSQDDGGQQQLAWLSFFSANVEQKPDWWAARRIDVGIKEFGRLFVDGFDGTRAKSQDSDRKVFEKQFSPAPAHGYLRIRFELNNGALARIRIFDAVSGALLGTAFDSDIPFYFFPDQQDRVWLEVGGGKVRSGKGRSNITVTDLQLFTPKGKQTVTIGSTQVPVANQASAATPGPRPTSGFYSGASALYRQDFENGKPSDWSMASNVSVADGVMRIDGNNWNGGGRSGNLREGQGVLVSYRFTPNSEFELFLQSGDWGAPEFRRWGIYGSYSRANIWVGTDLIGDMFENNIHPQPGRWYVLLLRLGGDGEFIIRMWDRDNPDHTFEMHRQFDSSWANRSWDFGMSGNSGTLELANYQEVEFAP